MSERERLMRRISAVDFAIIELHLFLDSHPNNKEMANKLDQYKTKSRELRNEYEEQFGPISLASDNGNRWAWIAGPWPWENSQEENL